MLSIKHKFKFFILLLVLIISIPLLPVSTHHVAAQGTGIPPGCPGGPDGPFDPNGPPCPVNTDPKTIKLSDAPPPHYACGSGSEISYISFNLGCAGNACVGGSGGGGYCGTNHNPILDGVFAVIQFLSVGVGVVIVASTVYGGIMYTLAGDDPHAVASAKERLQNNVIALLIYIFAFAILDYLLPQGFFK